jgi:hypothetical protein
MPEVFVNSNQGEIGLDDWGELLARFPRHSPRALASSLRSEGYRLQQMIKTAILLGGIAEAKLDPLHPHTLAVRAWERRARQRAARRAKGVRVRKIKRLEHVEVNPGGIRPLRKLAGGTRYEYNDSVKTVTIGFFKMPWREIAEQHATGFKTPVNNRMRKMMFAAGFPLAKGTQELTVPARPVVGPIYKREKDNIIRNVQDKTITNIYRYLTGKSQGFDKQESKLTI